VIASNATRQGVNKETLGAFSSKCGLEQVFTAERGQTHIPRIALFPQPHRFVEKLALSDLQRVLTGNYLQRKGPLRKRLSP
jgi:hypothetical protein